MYPEPFETASGAAFRGGKMKERPNMNHEEYRIEHDSLGEMRVPAERLYGAQTQRSLLNFPIGNERMPAEIISAFAILKKACALTNEELSILPSEKASLICEVCDEILSGGLGREFPLSVWQTGSGTQTNMNVNEVIAGRGNQIAGKELLHPNDDVNCSQSSNDTFPTAMHIAAACSLHEHLLPQIDETAKVLRELEEKNKDVIKIGRTHLMDAVPLTFAQEIFGWRGMLESSRSQIETACEALYPLAIGGTAVGTGLNAPEGFAARTAARISELTSLPFVSEENKFHALTSRDALVFAHGALKGLAANMMKIANDVRLLASGPRCGLGEITIPENEPGSSIMPGKVNPTQCESVTMVAVQVMGNDAAIGFAASQGNFELNVFLPVIIFNFLQSARLLADSLSSFRQRCLAGIRPNRAVMEQNLSKSLMLVTSLSPVIGYENAAKIAQHAHKEGLTLKQAALASGLIDEKTFDEAADPKKML